MSTCRRTFVIGLAVAGLAAASGPATAQKFPEKPITMIIPLGAGGSHDLNARIITSVLPGLLGQPVVIQLMPGAGGQTGTAAAAQAAPDGYTLIYTHNFIDQLQPHVSKLPYDTNKSFVSVARTNTGDPVVVVRADSPFKTLKEMLDYGRANPGKLKYGHSGNWGATMVPGAMMLAKAGVRATLVPYQGGGPAMRALLAGDSDFTVSFPSVYFAQEKSLRVLAIVGDEKLIPGVPLISEIGFPEITAVGTMHRIVLAPRGVPADRLEILRKAFAALPKDKTYATLMKKIGENTAHMDGDAYEKIRPQQDKEYSELVKSLTK
jgi:tripartite-type tricarboxylate transporter receptor subunit TctC